MEQDLENVVFNQVADAATGPADTMFTLDTDIDTSGYTGEDFDLGSEFSLSKSGESSAWASTSGTQFDKVETRYPDPRLPFHGVDETIPYTGAKDIGFEDAVASRIYKTYGEKMTGELGEGWTANLSGDIDPEYAGEGSMQFRGVGKPFL